MFSYFLSNIYFNFVPSDTNGSSILCLINEYLCISIPSCVVVLCTFHVGDI